MGGHLAGSELGSCGHGGGGAAVRGLAWAARSAYDAGPGSTVPDSQHALLERWRWPCSRNSREHFVDQAPDE